MLSRKPPLRRPKLPRHPSKNSSEKAQRSRSCGSRMALSIRSRARDLSHFPHTTSAAYAHSSSVELFGWTEQRLGSTFTDCVLPPQGVFVTLDHAPPIPIPQPNSRLFNPLLPTAAPQPITPQNRAIMSPRSLTTEPPRPSRPARGRRAPSPHPEDCTKIDSIFLQWIESILAPERPVGPAPPRSGFRRPICSP